MKKPFAWSYSALDGFFMCPRKHYWEKINKKYPFTTNAAADYGKEVHKAFELYVVKKKPLSLDLQHHQKFIDGITGLGVQVLGEQKLALTEDFKPTGWFDNDVWCRGIIDLAVIRDNSVIICDYKTGKEVDSFEQVDMQGAMLAAHMPELNDYTVGYYYTKSKTMPRQSFKKDNIPKVWGKLLPRVQTMKDMIAAEQFPARPNFLCKNYCPVKECQNCGI